MQLTQLIVLLSIKSICERFLLKNQILSTTATIEFIDIVDARECEKLLNFQSL